MTVCFMFPPRVAVVDAPGRVRIHPDWWVVASMACLLRILDRLVQSLEAHGELWKLASVLPGR